MVDLTSLILQVRDEYLENRLADNFQLINCGLCMDFADEIESRFKGACSGLSNDHFIVEREGSDGWNGDDQDIWSEEWLTFYQSLPPTPYTIKDLTLKVRGYHYWIFYEGKHYDSECPEGVFNLFHLPFFKRYLQIASFEQ